MEVSYKVLKWKELEVLEVSYRWCSCERGRLGLQVGRKSLLPCGLGASVLPDVCTPAVPRQCLVHVGSSRRCSGGERQIVVFLIGRGTELL
jgi:hypothetical protein